MGYETINVSRPRRRSALEVPWFLQQRADEVIE